MAKQKKRLRIVIVDDHPIVRRGLKDLIEQERDLEVCCEADDAQAAMKALAVHAHGLAIVDLLLRNSSGIDLVKEIHRKYPDLPVLVVSMYEESVYAERVLRAGARGYVMKHELNETIINAIRRVLAGGIYVSDAISEHILRGLASTRHNKFGASVQSLSDRELEVFRMVGRGIKTQDIAARLQVSSKTVETYRARIKGKLNIGSSSDLMQFAVEYFLWEKKP
jgi:DNA-binding NarL/FixJ family response regulator